MLYAFGPKTTVGMPDARKKRASVAPSRSTGSDASPRTRALLALVARTIAASGGVK
jgi:hypothetical protein